MGPAPSASVRSRPRAARRAAPFSAPLLLWSAVLCACSGTGSREPDRLPLERFVRIRPEPASGASAWVGETSVREYRHPGSGRTVVLLAMTHVGSRAYYEALTPWTKSADVVLAEGSGGQPPGQRLDDREMPPIGRAIRRLHAANAALLGLALQFDWECDVADGRWRLADLRTDRLIEALEELDMLDPPESMRARVAERERLATDGTPAEQARAREEWIADFAASIRADGTAPGTPMARLTAEREREMWRGIRGAVESGEAARIAVVIGAEHARNLAPRLSGELGFTLVREEWREFFRSESAR